MQETAMKNIVLPIWKDPSPVYSCIINCHAFASPSPWRRAAETPPGWGCQRGSLWGSLCTTAWALPRWIRCSWSDHPGPLEPACCCVSPWCFASLGGRGAGYEREAEREIGHRWGGVRQTTATAVMPLCCCNSTGLWGRMQTRNYLQSHTLRTAAWSLCVKHSHLACISSLNINYLDLF